MTANPVAVGNILGAGRAEADSAMLAKAFVETADYRALVQSDDFNFVVGRRGTANRALAELSGVRQCIAILKFGMLHVGAEPQQIPGAVGDRSVTVSAHSVPGSHGRAGTSG